MRKILDYTLLAIIVGLSIIVCIPVADLYTKVANKCIEKTVRISVTYETFDDYGEKIQVKIFGHGVFITSDGYVLSCKHLFELPEAKRLNPVILELSDGSLVAADIVNISKKADLALLREYAAKNVPFASLADPRKLKVGQEVIAVGSPLGLTFTVTKGIISQLYRDLGPQDMNMVQTDAAINLGNSGGPLFNMKGEIVGINTLCVPLQNNLGFAVPSNICLEFLVLTAKKVKVLRGVKWVK